MNVQAAKASIDTYFASEASEMYILIIAGVGLAILAGLVFTLLSGRFSQVFAAGLLALALLHVGTGIGLLVRDKGNHAQLNAVLDAPVNQATIERVRAERDRVKVILGSYRNLEYMFAGFAVAGAGLILFWPAPVGMALSALLFIVSFNGVLIDQYSKQRATTYYHDLTAALRS